MKNRTALTVKCLWIAVLLLSVCFFLPGKHAAALSLSLDEPGTQVHDGTVGQTYFGSIYLANGTAPYTYEIIEGSLPPGLKLGCEGGVAFADISGTPSQSGTFTFTVKATDVNNNQGSWKFSIRISGKETHYNVYVTGGEAQNVYYHAATTFQAGEHITLAWQGYAPAGYCLERWDCPDSVDLDQYNCFYMPAENVTIEAVFTEILKGSYRLVDTTIAGNGGPCEFSADDEHTLDAAWKAGLIDRKLTYSSNNYAWHRETNENRLYDLDKDGNFDLQLVRVSYSTGGVMRYGGTAATSNLADSFILSLPDDVIAAQETTVYETIEFILEHKLQSVSFSYPTCTDPGVKQHYVCIGCGALFWDAKGKYPVEEPGEVDLAPYGHSMTYVNGSNPTCTEGGLLEHYECSECHKWYEDPEGKYIISDHNAVNLPANGHAMTHIGGLKPTCTEDGVVEHYECSECKEWFWDAEGKHPVTDQSAVVLKAYGHSLSRVEAKAAGCAEEGNTEYYVCSACHEWFSDESGEHLITDHSAAVLPVLGHDMTSVTFHYPTCLEDGIKEHYICGRCGQWFWDQNGEYPIEDHSEVDLPALGHDMTSVEFHYPTCTEDGVKEHFICDNCEEWFWDQEGQYPIADHSEVVLPALGHDMTSVEFHYPTCLEDGVKEHYICGNCEEWFWDQDGENLITDHSEVILPALGHSMIPISGKDATCTEAGVIEHYECSECDEWFWDAEGLNPVADHADVIREALGHDWSEWKVIKEATATEYGMAERICRHDIMHIETKEILPIGGVPETTPGSDPEKFLKIAKKLLTVPSNGTAFTDGETVSYQVIAENSGSETLHDVTVTDEISGKQWTVKELAPGEKEIFTVERALSAADLASGEFVYVPAETEAVPPETSAAPAETTKAAEQPTNAATQAPEETTASGEPEKGGSGSSGIPAWVLIPAVGLGAVSAGLAVTLIGKNKALAAAKKKED
ncbi:MAG: putative Ig domain-containing protein [Lachnospiraceae bacterium]|nr:putative Ig domain-containing protein [Lachnospiraceae bacterium]